MFWGLIIDSNKKYSQTIEKSFHISMASLDVQKTSEPNNVQVSVTYDNTSYLLCTLNKNKIVQQALDLNFAAESTISFSCSGNGRVHLTGYLIPEEDDLEDDPFDDDGEESDVEQIPDLVPISGKKRKAESNKKNTSKKSKVEEDDDSDSSDDDYTGASNGADVEDDDDDDEDDDEDEDDDDDSDDEDEDDDDEEEEEDKIEVKGKPEKKSAKNNAQINGKSAKEETKQGQQKKNKEKKNNSKTENESVSQPQQKSKKETLKGGVQIEDIRVGNGVNVAKSGKFVTVYYVGRLKNGKIFDQTVSGQGFRFRLGKGEVIQGWNVGITGMKVGGKRRITIPPSMGYGAKGSPPVIPPHSHLIFEVELKEIS